MEGTKIITQKVSPMARVMIDRIKHIIKENKTPGMYESAIERIREIHTLLMWMGAEGEDVISPYDYAVIKNVINDAFSALEPKA